VITDLQTKRNQTLSQWQTFLSFTYKMAANINWHRYEMIITSVSPYVFSVRLLNTAESLWCLLIVDFRSVLVSGSNRNHGGLF